MRTFLLPFFVFILSTTILAQTPTPSGSTTPNSNTNQAQSSPSLQSSPSSTSVKISTSGLELSGFPTWIIWVVLGIGVVAFLIWFTLLRTDKAEMSMFATGGIAVVAVLVLLPLGGYWLGRRWANQELQQAITASAERTLSVSVPQPTPIPTPTFQAVSGVATWPTYIVIMGFVLLAGLEGLLYFYILMRLRGDYNMWHHRHITEQALEFTLRSLENLPKN